MTATATNAALYRTYRKNRVTGPCFIAHRLRAGAGEVVRDLPRAFGLRACCR